MARESDFSATGIAAFLVNTLLIHTLIKKEILSHEEAKEMVDTTLLLVEQHFTPKLGPIADDVRLQLEMLLENLGTLPEKP